MEFNINEALLTSSDKSGGKVFLYRGGIHDSRDDSKDHLSGQTKDTTIQSLIPDNITECSLLASVLDNDTCDAKYSFSSNDNAECTVCVPDSVIFSIADVLKIDKSEKSKVSIIAEAKKKTGCTTQKCVIEKLQPQMLCYFKIAGPTDDKLLSNFDIDSLMKSWQLKWKCFFPYNFNMRDFNRNSYKDGRVVHDVPDTLETIKFVDLYDQGFRCAGCVINTDKYDGPGKHWMALFVDMRGTSASIEFFNSSGNSLRESDEFYRWLVKTKEQLDFLCSKIPAEKGKKPSIYHVSTIRHQKSKTECGVYSLFYIWARLNKTPIDYFLTKKIPDQFMFNFRQLLFDDSKSSVYKFDWNTYQSSHKLKWEKD
jgi:hypothetical protein